MIFWKWITLVCFLFVSVYGYAATTRMYAENVFSATYASPHTPATPPTHFLARIDQPTQKPTTIPANPSPGEPAHRPANQGFPPQTALLALAPALRKKRTRTPGRTEPAATAAFNYDAPAVSLQIASPPHRSAARISSDTTCTSTYDYTRLNIQFYGFRFYDPQTGRWPNRDPIGERGGYNLYTFVNNNSMNSMDFLGLSRLEITLNECPCSQDDIIRVGYEASLEADRKSREHTLPRDAILSSSWGPEYGGQLCCNKKTREVKSTGPWHGDIKRGDEGVTVETRGRYRYTGHEVQLFAVGDYDHNFYSGDNEIIGCDTLGEEWITVGMYHSHPTRPGAEPNLLFSEDDIVNTWANSVGYAFIGSQDSVVVSVPYRADVFNTGIYAHLNLTIGVIHDVNEGVIGNRRPYGQMGFFTRPRSRRNERVTYPLYDLLVEAARSDHNFVSPF